MATTNEIVREIDKGKIVCIDKEVNAKDLDWNAHAKFKGVFLKHLVKGEDTDGKFSCHLVKVESDCEIGEHIHDDKWELHEIISGEGKGMLAGKEISLKSGISMVIPKGVKHKVIAGKDGLYLLAKFIPALV